MLFPLTAITFPILFYVNDVLCSLGVGEKWKIWMFWKSHPFPTPFLSSAALRLHLCCQQACFPGPIQGRSRYAPPNLWNPKVFQGLCPHRLQEFCKKTKPNQNKASRPRQLIKESIQLVLPFRRVKSKMACWQEHVATERTLRTMGDLWNVKVCPYDIPLNPTGSHLLILPKQFTNEDQVFNYMNLSAHYHSDHQSFLLFYTVLKQNSKYIMVH